MDNQSQNNPDSYTENQNSQTANPYFYEKKPANNRSVNFKLHQEQLDIFKKSSQTNEVNIYKEIIHEQKTITVPITREELVIEKKVLLQDSSCQKGEQMETIRIPISEEHIDISKHTVILTDIDIYKQQIQETQRVGATLKHEEVHLETKGHPQVIDH